MHLLVSWTVFWNIFLLLSTIIACDEQRGSKCVDCSFAEGPVLATTGWGSRFRDWNISLLDPVEKFRMLLLCYESALSPRPADVKNGNISWLNEGHQYGNDRKHLFESEEEVLSLFGEVESNYTSFPEGKKNDSLLAASKICRRFSLPTREQNLSDCPLATSHLLAGKNMHKIELRWNNKVYLEIGFLDSKMDITRLIMAKFDGSIELFLNYMIPRTYDKQMDTNTNKIERGIGNEMSAGAMLEDVPLQAARLDLFLTSQKNPKEAKIFYKLWEPPNEHLSRKTRDGLLRACVAKIDRWNRNAGTINYVFKEEECLRTNDERNRMYGVDTTINPNPEGRDQIWGGRATGPLKPKPKNLTNEWTNTYHIEIALYDNKPSAGKERMKREAVVADKAMKNCTLKEFDLREHFLRCKIIIGMISNQMNCSYDWAMATASALTDRACIINAKKRNTIRAKPLPNRMSYQIERSASARDAIECSNVNIQQQNGKKCYQTSLPSKVWLYYNKRGTVNEKCKPSPGNNSRDALKPRVDWEEKCHHQCDEKSMDNGSLDFLKWGISLDKKSYHEEVSEADWRILKMFAGTLYTVAERRVLFKSNFEHTMTDELKENGPIIVVFDVYEDFEMHAHHEKLPYSREPNAKPTGRRQAVRLIGWGQMDCDGEKVSEYWLAANSKGTEWGDKGLFRIARGHDECGIESIEVSWGSSIFPFWQTADD